MLQLKKTLKRLYLVDFAIMEYTTAQRKQYINAKQLYEHYLQKKRAYYLEYNLSMFWKKAGGREYLTKQKSSTKKTTSLGVKSEETIKIYEDFIKHKKALQEDLRQIEEKLTKIKKLNKLELLTRVPTAIITIFQKINELGLDEKILLIGTNSLYAYESHCGIFVEEEQLATEDIDLLSKKNKDISLIFTEVLPGGKLTELLTLIDKSFKQDVDVPYRFKNKEGVLLELINPISQKIDLPCYKEDLFFTDVIALEMNGMQWLENSRVFKSMVIGDSGACAIIPTIHPLEFAVYKNWLSCQKDRNIIKKQRDLEQSKLITKLIQTYMVNININQELDNMRHFKRSVISSYREDILLF